MKCLGINKEHVLLNNLGSKHSLVMKLRQLCNITKGKTKSGVETSYSS